MKRKLLKIFCILFLTVIAGNCISLTVNVNFPAGEVQKAADKVVGDIRGKETNQDTAPEGKPQSFKKIFIFAIPVAYAEVNVDVSTPPIRKLKKSMKERFPDLEPFYNKGAIGEGNEGLVDIRDIEGLDLKERAKAKKLVNEENGDREALYREIAKANKFGEETIPDIKKIFANSWREDARTGWWIQKNNGQWGKK